MEIIRKISLKTALIVIGAVFAMVANAIPTRPEPQRLVNDQASIFTHDQKEYLERMLVAFDELLNGATQALEEYQDLDAIH